MPVFEPFPGGWQEQGYKPVSLRQYLASLEGILPHAEITMRKADGRIGTLTVQEVRFFHYAIGGLFLPTNR